MMTGVKKNKTYVFLSIALAIVIGVASFFLFFSSRNAPSDSNSHSRQSFDISFITACENISFLLPVDEKLYAVTGGGLLEFDLGDFSFRKYVIHHRHQMPVITDIIADSAGKVWLGTNVGLACLQGDKVTFHEEIEWPVKSIASEDGRLNVLGENLRVYTILSPGGPGQKVGVKEKNQLSEKAPYLFYECDGAATNDARRRLLGYNSARRSWDIISDRIPSGSLHSLVSFEGKLYCLLYDRRGSSTLHYYGLSAFTEGQWLSEREILGPELAGRYEYTALCKDDDTLYAASAQGILELSSPSTNFLPFPDEYELRGTFIESIAVVSGRIWLGTRTGIGYFDGIDWYFNSFTEGLVDNDIQSFCRSDEWLLIRSKQGGALYDKYTGHWYWESESDANYALSGTDDGQPLLYKVTIKQNNARIYRLLLPGDIAGNKWNWTEMVNVPPLHGRIKLFGGDHQKNIWLLQEGVLWRFRAGKWSYFNFLDQETISHRFIQAEEHFISDGLYRPSHNATVEQAVIGRDNTCFLLRGRGWTAIIEYRAERWKSHVIYDRTPQEIKLISSTPQGIWYREGTTIYFQDSQEKKVMWSDEEAEAIRIPAFWEGEEGVFLVLSQQNRSRFTTDIFEQQDGKWSHILALPPLSGGTPVDLELVGTDLWVGTNQGIMIIHSIIEGAGNANQAKVVVTYGEISVSSISEPEKLIGLPFPAILPASSPDLRKIAMVHLDGGKKLIRIWDSVDKRIIPFLPNSSFTTMYKPSFDTSGENLLFYAVTGKGREDLFMANIASGELTQLTNKGGKNWDPEFSPNGQEITYTSNRWGNNDIYIYSRTTGKSLRLTNDRSSEWHPTFSPDAKKIAYVRSSRENPGDIWVMDSQGKDQRALVTDPGKDWLPAWSPDGRYIAFTGFRGGFHHLFLYDIRKEMEIQATTGPYNDYAPQWTADGKNILFHSDRTGLKEIWKIQVR